MMWSNKSKMKKRKMCDSAVLEATKRWYYKFVGSADHIKCWAL